MVASADGDGVGGELCSESVIVWLGMCPISVRCPKTPQDSLLGCRGKPSSLCLLYLFVVVFKD